MKKILSGLAGLSLMAAPMASATASTRPASAVPMVSTSSYVLDDHDDDDDDELFILAVMAGALILVAITVFDSDDDAGDFIAAPQPPVSGA